MGRAFAFYIPFSSFHVAALKRWYVGPLSGSMMREGFVKGDPHLDYVFSKDDVVNAAPRAAVGISRRLLERCSCGLRKKKSVMEKKFVTRTH